MGEEESADGGAGVHGAGFGEGDAGGVLCVEEFEDRRLFGVVRLGRIAGSRADATVDLFDELIVVELVGAFISPLDPGAVVEEFGKGLGESVGEGFNHDRFVGVVLVGGDFLGPFVGAVDTDDEGADVVGGDSHLTVG